MSQLATDKDFFKNHPSALCATDVSFQQANRPSGMHLESKKYFSNRQKMYGYKTEVSVLPNGIALACSDHDPGSVSYLAMFRSMAHFHRRATKNNEHDSLTPDHGPLRTLYPMNWAIPTDKAYQGAPDSLRVLYPKKKPPHGRLSLDDEGGNAELSSDRVIVENVLAGSVIYRLLLDQSLGGRRAVMILSFNFESH